MNKSKHFVFIGVETALMLLVIGSWVTSAQASAEALSNSSLIKCVHTACAK